MLLYCNGACSCNVMFFWRISRGYRAPQAHFTMVSVKMVSEHKSACLRDKSARFAAVRYLANYYDVRVFISQSYLKESVFIM